jgi:hypothetical protein
MILQRGYDKVSFISTYFKVCDEQAHSLKKTAEILVGKAVENLSTDPCRRSILN